MGAVEQDYDLSIEGSGHSGQRGTREEKGAGSGSGYGAEGGKEMGRVDVETGSNRS